jgi:hypothetical protein
MFEIRLAAESALALIENHKHLVSNLLQQMLVRAQGPKMRDITFVDSVGWRGGKRADTS